MPHVRDRVEARELLRRPHAAKSLRHIFIGRDHVENILARIAEARKPDDLAPIVDRKIVSTKRRRVVMDVSPPREGFS